MLAQLPPHNRRLQYTIHVGWQTFLKDSNNNNSFNPSSGGQHLSDIMYGELRCDDMVPREVLKNTKLRLKIHLTRELHDYSWKIELIANAVYRNFSFEVPDNGVAKMLEIRVSILRPLRDLKRKAVQQRKIQCGGQQEPTVKAMIWILGMSIRACWQKMTRAK